MNQINLCNHPGYLDKLCWVEVLLCSNADVFTSEQPSDIQDDITICHECDRFIDITERGFGRRAADQAVMTSVMKLIDQLMIKKQNLQKTAEQLKYSLEQLGLLKNIVEALARSDTLEKSVKIILTGATSGDAFGFNRAAIFLIDDKNHLLKGKAAIGPENREEAIRIWEEISRIPLDRLLEEILIENEFVSCTLETIVSTIRILLSDNNNPLIRILNTADEKIIDFNDEQYHSYLSKWWPPTNKIAVVQLKCEGKPLGLIMADNGISGKPITGKLVSSLKSLASACAPGLQNAILHQKLQAQYKELERVHELFKSNQAYLLRHERLADIGTLATKVAHEFKTPLVTIGGYARRILKSLNGDRLNNNMVEIIIKEIDRLTKITSEILEYSRYSKLNIKKCNLNSIVDETLSQMEEKLGLSGIDLEKIFSNKTLNVGIDSERMKQVIFNLIDNAIDAMDKGGKLTVKTIKHKEYISLEISDSGSGIEKPRIESLFNLFYTTKDKGSGLGLPVSKKIVDDHGGYINVDSTPGKGSVFSVRIPAYKSD